jgi:hypothetical protein
MAQAGGAEETQRPTGAGPGGVIALGAVMVLASAPAVVYAARSSDHASWVPWLLAAGPIVGLAVTWIGGSFRDARPTPRAQATHFALTGVMVALLLLVIAVDGPTGVVAASLAYCAGFWLLLIASLLSWQERRTAGGAPPPSATLSAEPARPRDEINMSDQPITVGAFLRDLRWMLPGFVVMSLVFSLLTDLDALEAVLFAVFVVVVLGPVMWVGEKAMFTRYARDPAFWRFFGGSVLWFVSSLVVAVVLFNAFGIW